MPKRTADDTIVQRPSRSVKRVDYAEDETENMPPTTMTTTQTPATPRKMVKTAGTAIPLPLTPVSAKRTISLFTPTKRNLSTPTRTPISKSSTAPSTPLSTIFTRAKATLRRGTVPGKLAARTAQRAEISTFLTTHLTERQRGGFMYICGPPGTGKTALMTEVFEELKSCPSNNVAKANNNMTFINCMSFERAEEVFDRIVDEFGAPGRNKGPMDTYLEKLFLKSKKSMLLVILDEMDHLVTKNQQVMYKLIEYANKPSSNLVLIGIANSLNLPDRFLPRLKAKNIEPKRLSFNPYTTEDIIEIIKARLHSLDPEAETVPLIDPKAIELCARKVSAASGDLRMALDMCRRAIELVESEELKKRETPLQEMNLQTPVQSPAKRRRLAATAELSTLSAASAPKVLPSHIMTVTKTLGSSQSFQSRLKSLSIHHKAILCTLVILKSSMAKRTLGDVADKYTRLCRRDRLLDPLPRGEIFDACRQLDGMDMIALEKGKKGRVGKSVIVDRATGVGLGIQDVDVLQAIAGMDMLAKFFEE